MQAGPQRRRLARLPPPERFPVAIKAPFVSAWSWSRSRRRRDRGGEGKEAVDWVFFPGGGLAARLPDTLPARSFSPATPSVSVCTSQPV